MKKITFILLVFLSIIGTAQNDKAYVDDLVSQFTSKLETRNIDTYFYATRYCEGTIEIFQLENGRMCASKGTYFEVYVFWMEGHKPMIKKIDNCGMYYSLTLNDATLFEYYAANTASLKKDKVKGYEAENWTGIPKSRTKIHSCYRVFNFANAGNLFDQKYNLFDLTNESDSKNKNYEYNLSTSVSKLDAQIDTAITQKEPQFKRLNLR